MRPRKDVVGAIAGGLLIAVTLAFIAWMISHMIFGWY